MKKEVEEFRNINGPEVKYSVKELIGALHIKMDRFDKKISKKADKKLVYTLFGGGITLLSVMLGALLYMG